MNISNYNERIYSANRAGMPGNFLPQICKVNLKGLKICFGKTLPVGNSGFQVCLKQYSGAGTLLKKTAFQVTAFAS
jgi:hypothetical protein